MNSASEIIDRLKSLASPANVEGMARFGINSKDTLGISIPVLRKVAKEVSGDHELALELWESGLHEARILAAFIDDPRLVTEEQMEVCVADFDSWDVCDQVCGSLFDKTPFAFQKAIQWAEREEEFVRRAGFAMMAMLAWHDKEASNEDFMPFFPLMVRYAADPRNFVKKAINWALRQAGKRNSVLRSEAIITANEILKLDSKTARWIASNAIKELRNKKF